MREAALALDEGQNRVGDTNAIAATADLCLRRDRIDEVCRPHAANAAGSGPNSLQLNDVKTTHDDLIVAAHRAHAGENINRSGGQMAREVAETNIPTVAYADAAPQR